MVLKSKMLNVMKKDYDDMPLPLVTVITLSYNNEQYIFEAINSVLKQTYPNIEYIISDDGSVEFPESSIQELLTEGYRGNISW